MNLGELVKKLDEAIATVGREYPVAFLDGSLDPTNGQASGERAIDSVVLMHPVGESDDDEQHPRCVFLVNLN